MLVSLLTFFEPRQDGLCGYCFQRREFGLPNRIRVDELRQENRHSRALLREVAYNEYRRLQPRSLFGVEQNSPHGENCWWLSSIQLLRRSMVRGTRDQSDRSRLRNINLLQIDDAFNGIVLRPSPVASALHDLSVAELRRRAREAGYGSNRPKRRMHSLNF